MAARKTRHDEDTQPPARGVRAFWSGTISFGLVTVPVNLFPATRGAQSKWRLLDRNGTPLSRRYYCPQHNRDVHPEHILRGYELENGEYVIVSDEDLEAIEPKKTREIDLRSFVRVEQIPPLYFERSYFLTPAGDSNKAYRLLAAVMEQTQRAGIATFVMRDKEYLIAIIAQDGILHAETLRFQDEIRDAKEVGLPLDEKPHREQVTRFERLIKQHTTESLDLEELRDTYSEAVQQLAESKRERGENVVDAKAVEPSEDADEAPAVDLLETIRRSLRGAPSAKSQAAPHRARVQKSLAEQTVEELQNEAKRLKIAGRSRMTKQELVRAIRRKSTHHVHEAKKAE